MSTKSSSENPASADDDRSSVRLDQPVDLPERPGEDAPGSRLALLSWRGLLAFAVVLALGVWTGQGLVSLFSALVIATGLVGRVWAGASLLSLVCKRDLAPLRAFPGEIVRLNVTLDNRKPMPLSWIRVEQRIPRAIAPVDLSLDPTEHPAIGRLGFSTSLGWYEVATWHCRLNCQRRGYYLIGRARILSGDIFGLFLQSRSVGEAIPVIVYPRRYALAELGLPSHQPLGDANDPSQLFEDPSRLSGLRDYTGDTPFKNIAWAASARHGQLQAKRYEMTVTLQTALFLVVDSFTRAGEAELFEVAVSAAASLAERLIGDRQMVGIYANGLQAGGIGALGMSPGSGEDQLLAIFEGLARLYRAASEPFPPFLDAHASTLRGYMTLCVIAAHLPDAIVERLAQLRRQGYAVAALIVGSGPMPEGQIPCLRIDGSHLMVNAGRAE